MLVLSRKTGEVIKIGDDVEVVVVDIRGNKVRLGITAPREIEVHRKEVYDAIKKEEASRPMEVEWRLKKTWKFTQTQGD